MALFTLAAKSILVTIGLVAAALGLAALIVIFARLDVNTLDIIYLMAALITVSGAIISLVRWLASRRR